MTSYTVTLLAGSYTWRVRAYNTSGWSGWSSTRVFTITTTTPNPPVPPDLMLPAGGTVSASMDITFSWTGSVGATSYQIEINGPSNKLDSISVTYYSVTLTPGSYTWRARAYNASGWSDWSVARVLAVQVPPEPIPWWVYLVIAAAMVPVVFLVYWRTRSRRPTFGTSDDSDTVIYPD